MGVYVNESGTLGDNANVRGILAEWSIGTIGTGTLALVLNQLLYQPLAMIENGNDR